MPARMWRWLGVLAAAVAVAAGLGWLWAAIPAAGRVGALPTLAVPLGELAATYRATQAFLTGITGGRPIPFLLVDPQERTLFTNAATMRRLEIDAPPESQYGRTLAEVFSNGTGRETVVGTAMRKTWSLPTRK